jgi:hypothetical protein|tara:strand:+ start:3939 stop:4181 length:243 start_codon:yes stop_codon:yes gene_type:complete
MIERIKLNDELKAGLAGGRIRTQTLVEWLIREHGFTSTKSLPNTSLSTMAKDGLAVVDARFDRLLQEIEVTLELDNRTKE